MSDHHERAARHRAALPYQGRRHEYVGNPDYEAAILNGSGWRWACWYADSCQFRRVRGLEPIPVIPMMIAHGAEWLKP